MKALTISQPYASLISNGIKWVENRNWRTHYRGPLAIHAGQGTQYMTRAQMDASQLPVGAVVAACELVACVKLDSLRVSLGLEYVRQQVVAELGGHRTIEEVLRHKYTEGPWCWVLASVERLDRPVAAKGKQGFWEWGNDSR